MRIVGTRDVAYAIITGVTTGLLTWLSLHLLEKKLPYDLSFNWLPIIIPVLWILGVQFGYVLGTWMAFFNQFGKFAAIGFTNFAVDSAVLNILLSESQIHAGFWYSVFTGISFCVAVIHSYFWNRTWSFESREQQTSKEFATFFAIMVISLLIKVGTAAVVVNVIGAQFDIDGETWGNVGNIIGSAAALIFSFVGFKLVVFKKNI